MAERRTAGEVRAEGRRLSGTVLDFGDTSPSHRERFSPGSLKLGEAVSLNLFHDAERAIAWHPGGGLNLRTDAGGLRMEAELPPIPAADRALQEVRSGRTTGLSLEFRALEEHREAGLRVVDSAEILGIGLVRKPSYDRSRVEARQSSGFSLRSFIPSGTRLDCECSGGECSYAEFSEPVVERMMDMAFETERNLIAVLKDYSAPLASTNRGTLIQTAAGGFDIIIPDSPVGRAVLDADEAAGTVVRPYLDATKPTGRKVGDTRVYDGEPPSVRALVVSSTDKRGGWPSPKIVPTTPAEIATDVAANLAIGALLGFL